MRTSSIYAYVICLLFCFTKQNLAQIGQTKEELIQRYGPCQPNPAGKSAEPNAYDSVIDVGEDCTFHIRGNPALAGNRDLIITASFKEGKAVAFDYRVPHTFVDSLLAEQSEPYQKLSELDILSLRSLAFPKARWVKLPSNSTIQRSRTRDSTAFAYYFADGNYHQHELLVQTAAVDAVFKKADKAIRGLRPQ